MINENLENQHCPNQNCIGDVAIHDFKKNRFRCRLCKKTWVGRRGDCSYGLKTNPAKVKRAFEMLKAGISIRCVAKFSHVSPSTVMRWKKKPFNNQS